MKGKVECGFNTTLKGVTGEEVVERIKRARSLSLELGKVLAGNNIPAQEVDEPFEFTFNFTRGKFFKIEYLPHRGKWFANFYNLDSKTPYKGKPYKWGNTPTIVQTSYRSSKFEGKIFDMIIMFVDTEEIP